MYARILFTIELIRIAYYRLYSPKVWRIKNTLWQVLHVVFDIQQYAPDDELSHYTLSILPPVSTLSPIVDKYPLHALLGIPVNHQTIRSDIKSAYHGVNKEFSLFSAYPVSFGTTFPWHTDIHSQHTWMRYPAHDKRLFVYPKGADIKTVWDMGRCHHLLWLALGYESTNNASYAEQALTDIEDCMLHNPVGVGVQWAMPMEVAIRAINIVVCLQGIRSYLQHLASNDTKVFHQRIHRITVWLFGHGKFLTYHREYTRRPNNHLISNGLGLFVIGSYFLHHARPFRKDAEQWKNIGITLLEQTIQTQVYSDGGNYEKSISYHALVTEMYALAFAIGQATGHMFSSQYHHRLYQMHYFLQCFCDTHHQIPLIGDADNGRILRIDPEEVPTDMTSVLRFIHTHVPISKETAMAYRLTPLHHFAESGFVVHQTSIQRCIIDIGDYGMNGWGGHGHNDCLAFVLQIHGETLFTDTGCGSYTAYPDLRQQQRSTKAHNTVAVRSAEQCEFLNMWRIKKDATAPRILSLHANQYTLNCSMEHYGYVERYGLIHRRTLVLSHAPDGEQGEMMLSDEITSLSDISNADETAESFGFLHIPSGMTIEKYDEFTVHYTADQFRGTIWCSMPIYLTTSPSSSYYGDIHSLCSTIVYPAPAFVRVLWYREQRTPTIFSGYSL